MSLKDSDLGQRTNKLWSKLKSNVIGLGGGLLAFNVVYTWSTGETAPPETQAAFMAGIKLVTDYGSFIRDEVRDESTEDNILQMSWNYGKHEFLGNLAEAAVVYFGARRFLEPVGYEAGITEYQPVLNEITTVAVTGVGLAEVAEIFFFLLFPGLGYGLRKAGDIIEKVDSTVTQPRYKSK